MRFLAIATCIVFALPATAQQSQDQAPAQGGSFFSNLFSRPAAEAEPESFQELGIKNENTSLFLSMMGEYKRHHEEKSCYDNLYFFLLGCLFPLS